MSQQVTIQRNGTEPSIYVEGMSQIMIGFPTSRIVLHDLATPAAFSPNGTETQRMRCELIIPTAGLIEMCQTVLSHTAGVAENLKMGSNDWLGRVHVVLDSLKDVKFGAAIATHTESESGQ